MIFVLIEFLRGWLMPFPFWIKDLGKRGEYLARTHFHRRGYFCLNKNWRHGKGEIDLIMANYRKTVFVEVKARQRHEELHIGKVLDKGQAKRLMRLARHYMAPYAAQNIGWEFKLLLVAFERNSFSIEETNLVPFAGT